MSDASSLQVELSSSAAPALVFKSMSGLEEISRLFEFQVVATCDDQTITADAMLGTTVGVSLQVDDSGTQRWFHGMVAGFGIEGVAGRDFGYRLTVRPWAWLMTRASNIRIFQALSTLDIVKQVFGNYPITFVDQTTGSYNARPYCVQYRETDFNFVSRLLEEEGIFYFFQHADGKHDLVLADAPSAHVAQPGFADILYVEGEIGASEVQAIDDWHMQHEIQSGKVTLRDYNYTTPSSDLTSNTVSSSRSHAQPGLEHYDYPALYAVTADGNTRAGIRLEEASARFTRFTGKGNTPGLAAGASFTLTGHPRVDQNAEYVVLQTQIDIEQARDEASNELGTRFLCRFMAQQYADAFRPARITRKPTVAGPQTAVVVGSGNPGDINTDEYGRVKVQFFWDRLGKKDGQVACWVRVASPWAGNGWGMISLPRLGQEVVVDFLEGDPDQPLITGRVYNPEQMPPYVLPDNATVSTIKSRSLQGATDAFNELRFEDKAGSEYVWLQAQKDRLDFVENDFKTQVGNDEHRTITADLKEKVGGDHHLGVTGDHKQKIGGALHVQTGSDMLLKSGGGHSLKTSSDVSVDSGATISMKSATDMQLKIGGNLGAVAGQNVHVKGGMNLVIEAGVEITIKAGSSSIVLGPSGVSITGSMVMINSGGSPGAGAGANPVAPTAPADPVDPVAPSDPLSNR